jgi:TRAP-type C4-dicarboxylate transport system permease small subunit
MRIVAVSYIKKIFNALGMLAGFMIAVSTALAAVNAALRYGVPGVSGIVWSEEFCTFLCVLAVFISFPWMETENLHLKIDAFNTLIKNEMVKKATFIIRGILTISLFTFLFTAGLTTTITAYNLHTLTYVLNWPRYIIYSIVVISYGLVIMGWFAILFLNRGRDFKCLQK